jgi:hypothetical protein
MLLGFHVNFSFSGTVVLLQKIFEKICSIQTYVKTVSPIVAHPTLGGHDINKL